MGTASQVAFYLRGNNIHGTQTEREKEEQSCGSHEVSELLEAVQMLRAFQMAKGGWSPFLGPIKEEARNTEIILSKVLNAIHIWFGL